MNNNEQTPSDEETLISHLEALRNTLLRCLISLAIILPLTLYLSPYFLDWLIKILIQDLPVTLNFFSPAEVFILQIKIALVLDFVICFPYIAKQLWNFILPALYENERYFIKRIILSSSSLFILGVCFCISFILPLIIKFLWLSVIFGIMFQFPLITYSLIKSGICTYETVKAKRPYIFTLILIIAAILTPPDVF